MTVAVKVPGFKTWGDTLTAKPRDLSIYESVGLEIDWPKYELDSAVVPIAYDKLLADKFSDGEKIGYFKKQHGEKEPLYWEGNTKVGNDDFDNRFYEVVEKAGFRTERTFEADLFDQGKKKPKQIPRFTIATRLKDYNIRFWLEKSKLKAFKTDFVGETTMELSWQVLDRKTDEVVLKYDNVGVSRYRTNSSYDHADNLMAYEIGLRDFLANSDLHELVADAEPLTGPVGARLVSEERIELDPQTNPDFEELSDMIKYANKSCVTVITDTGNGSGVVIRNDGLVLTAFHVVDNINRIEVQFSEGLTLEAELVSYDEVSDVALLDITGSGYQVLPLNPKADTPLGEDVVTIGTPADVSLGQSVAKGMISGKREKDDIVVLQADIAVSPGNSGGPLLNNKGEVIGIVQSKIIGQGVEGIGFAIPIGYVMEALNISSQE